MVYLFIEKHCKGDRPPGGSETNILPFIKLGASLSISYLFFGMDVAAKQPLNRAATTSFRASVTP